MNIDIFWGVKGIDKGDISKWDARWDSETIGEVIWDESFDLSPEVNQQSLLDFCADLKTKDFVKGDDSTECWTDDFNAYLGQ